MKKFLLMLAVASAGFSVSSRAQLTQDFESTSGTSLPTGWTQNTATSPGWMSGTSSSFPAGQWSGYMNVVSHTRYAQVTDASASNLNTGDTLISPSFSLAGLTTPYLSFDQLYGGYAYTSGTNAGKHETALVFVSSNNGPWVFLDSVRGITSWTTQYKSLSAYAGATNLRIAFSYADGGAYLFGLAIDNVKAYSLPANDLKLVSVTPATRDAKAAYGAKGSGIPLGGTIQNNGGNAITSFTVNYQVGSAAVVSVPVTGISVTSFSTYNFTAGNLALPATAGEYNVKVWATLAGDANHNNDSGATVVGAYDNTPVKRLLIEEGTGTWCGYCVRGIVYMDSLEKLYGESKISLVAVHNADQMTVAAYDAFETSFPGFTGFPSAIIDRREVVDVSETLLQNYSDEHDIFAFADVKMGKHTLTGGTTLSVPVTVTPGMPLSGDYRLVLVITEDKVHHPGAVTGWEQHNYYANSYSHGQLPALSGGGISYTDSNEYLTNVYFDHVARAISPSAKGSANLPATMTTGTAYTATLTATINNAAWNLTQCKAIAMLIRGSDGVVLNTYASSLYTEGVTNVAANITKATLYPNPSSTLTNVALILNSSSTVHISVADMLGRQVYATPAEQYAAGNHNITFSTAAFAPGNYTVSICTENGTVTQQLTVAK